LLRCVQQHRLAWLQTMRVRHQVCQLSRGLKRSCCIDIREHE